MLNEKFKNLYSPKRELCVDESIILFKGRSSMKQYNPMKSIKRGHKIWCLGDSSGYISKFEIYTGKRDGDEDDNKKRYGLGGSVVLSLSKDYLGKGYKLFFDNYFSSIPLMEKQKVENTYASGTIRSTRKDFPILEVDSNLERGQFDYRSTDQRISVYKWKDSKSVYLVSNYHGIEKTTVARTIRDGTKIVVPCPQVVQDYNKFMGGIDKHDMLRGLYGIDRKSRKWWHRLFFGLIDMAIINAYVIYCDVNAKIPLIDFRRNLAMGLVSKGIVNHHSNKRRKISYSVPHDVRLSNKGTHWPIFVESRGRCEVCSSNKIQSRPYSICRACRVHLCVNNAKNCFLTFHEEN
ncbi:UNVERIFIED_CONTAM: hypothetical protein RMT77_004069 [Armadillidium vulgare]